MYVILSDYKRYVMRAYGPFETEDEARQALQPLGSAGDSAIIAQVKPVGEFPGELPGPLPQHK